ncbi:MAG: YycH protein [Firmicutes bacterium ADurb.Bin193]|nr:MAG: YycH protein [Firmicutes bacterium ADurb.Bin193]
MEWSRVKSIMIGVFFIVNLVLFASYMGTTRTGMTINSETLENTVIILRNNNVSIDPELIPRKMQDIRVFDTLNRFEYAAAAVSSFWDKAQSLGLDYFNPEATVTDGASFEYKPENPPTIKHFNERTAQAYAKGIVNKLELGGGMSVESDVSFEDGGYVVAFYQVYEDSRVLDTRLVFEIKGDAVTRIYGKNWLCEEVTGGGLSPVRPVTEILVNFAVAQNNEGKGPLTISDVRLGYFIGDRNGKKSTITVVPVWRITVSSGEEFYYDARNGDLL